MLAVNGLRKRYGDHQVLDGVSFTVAPGECVALLGYNGTGKSTTMRIIAGLARADAGAVALCGEDALAGAASVRRLLSYLPQRPVFPAMLTVRETLGVIARLRRLPVARIDAEITACHLEGVAGRSVGALSGGERQRLGLAVALLPDAEFLLLDEPTVNLDEEATALLFHRVALLRAAGRGLLFTSHVASDVRAIASRSLRLHAGRIHTEIAAPPSTTAGIPPAAEDEIILEEPS